MVSQLQSNVTKFQTPCGKGINQFLNEYSKGSLETERAYRGDITRFLKTVFKNRTIDTVTFEELEEFDYDQFSLYIQHLQAENLSNRTINRHIRTIKKLYENLKARKLFKPEVDISFMNLVKGLPSDGDEIEAMPLEVFYEFLEASKKEKHHAHVKGLLMKLAVDQGIRLGALLKLTWKSFVPREDGVVIKGLDKGNKKFIKIISYDMYNELLTLKTVSRKSEKVFEPLTAKNVTDMMIRIRKKLGYEDEGYSFHSLRKTAFTHEHRLNGGDIIETQRFSGHADVNMLQVYVDSIDRGVKGIFSAGNSDSEAYKKTSHEELVKAIDELGLDVKYLINAKLQQNNM